MSVNGASHNIAGDRTGPVTAPPPNLKDDVVKDIVDASAKDSMGHSAPGRDGGKSTGDDILKGDEKTEQVGGQGPAGGAGKYGG